MKIIGDGRSRLLSLTYRGLLVCLIVLGILLIGGTVYAFFFRTVPHDVQNRQTEVPRQSDSSGQGQTFLGIGRVRASTADPQPEMVILSVTFIYYPGDKPFSEELVLKTREFREIIVDYIGSFSGAELHTQDEELIKAELLRRFNAILRLGQIDALFFSIFTII